MTQTRNRRHIIVSFALIVGGVVLIGFLFKGLDFRPKQIPSVLVGKPAPDFTASWILGREAMATNAATSFNLSDLKGKKVILNFWASWCVSCREEAVELQQFWEAQKDSGVLVVGVAVQDTTEDALRFANHYGKRYPLGLDTDGSAAINYGVTGVPETFFISREGMIVDKIIGPVDRASMASRLDKL